jgi:hypothetical protein
MIEKLIGLLAVYGYPVIMHGSMAEDEPFPNNFITFQLTGSPEQDFFDGNPYGTQWRFAVAFYTSDPALLTTVPQQIYTDLKAAGWIPQGKGYITPSDEPTHTGWVNEYYFLEV